MIDDAGPRHRGRDRARRPRRLEPRRVRRAACRRAPRGAAGTPAPVDSVVLLAPAFELAGALAEEFGPARMAAWESTGVLPVFHYGDNALAELGW